MLPTGRSRLLPTKVNDDSTSTTMMTMNHAGRVSLTWPPGSQGILQWKAHEGVWAENDNNNHVGNVDIYKYL